MKRYVAVGVVLGLLGAAGAQAEVASDPGCRWIQKPDGYFWDCSGFAIGGPYDEIGGMDAATACGWARKDGQYYSVCQGQTTGGPFREPPGALGTCGWVQTEAGPAWACSGLVLGGPYDELRELDATDCGWASKDGRWWRICSGQAVGGPFHEPPGTGDAAGCAWLRKDDGHWFTCSGQAVGGPYDEVDPPDARGCGFVRKAGQYFWSCQGQTLGEPLEQRLALDGNGCAWLRRADGHSWWWCSGFTTYGPLTDEEREPFERVVLRGEAPRPGDYVVAQFAASGKSCGFVFQAPGQVFVRCAGQIEAGPLDAAGLQEWSARWSAASRFAHNIRMSLLRAMPSGGRGGTVVDVYDERGNFLRRETRD